MPGIPCFLLLVSLTASYAMAQGAPVPPPVTVQNDYRAGGYLAELQVEDIKKGVAAFKEKLSGHCVFRMNGRNFGPKFGSRNALTVVFTCDTGKREAKAVRAKLAGLGELRYFGKRPDHTEAALNKEELRLAPLKTEYENNREAFEKIPIGSSLMEAALAEHAAAVARHRLFKKSPLTRLDISISQTIPDGLPQEELMRYQEKIFHKPGTPYKDPLTEP